MADVGAAAGMSSGSVFNYVENKEALFHLVFTRAFRPDGGGPEELPLPAPETGATARLIEATLRSVPVPHLKAAMDQDEPADVEAELRGIVLERYAVQESLWPVLAVIERCAAELPEIEEFYFRRTRVGYFGRLGAYLEKRARSGHLRAMPDFAISARIISEMISWFAWHRKEGREPRMYPDDAARETVVAFVCAALLPTKVS